MNRTDCIQLTQRLLERVQTNSSDSCEKSLNISAKHYTDPEQWQRERQQFFLNTPQVLGFSGQLADPGSYLTAESMGIPILMTRDEQGVLRAFINSCTHRGAQIAEGSGQRSRLSCKFHGWTYHLDGSLAGRPCEAAFKSSNGNSGLTQLPIADNCGLLVVGLRSDIAQQRVDHFLDDIELALDGFEFQQLRHIETRKYSPAAHWKLVVNLSHESYHFATLHRDSLAPLMTHHAVVDQFGLHTRWAFPLKSIADLASMDETQWPDQLPGAINHTIFPGTLIITNGGDAQIIRTEPGDRPGSSTVYYTGGYRDESTLEESRSAYEFGGDIFSSEDLPAAEQCQKGIDAGLTTLVAGSNEPVVQLWQQRWEQTLDSSGD